jgi:5-methylcytosine-specific restriction endonuclease McrA
MKTNRASRSEKNQGMNWLRPEKRLALYLRDGLACAYCGEGIEEGAKLTLDHLTPYSLGGSNKATNLVCCCHRCNSSRGNRDYTDFAKSVASYLDHDVKAADIIRHIRQTVTRPLDLNAAKELIARRGGFTAALHNAE